MIKIIGYIIGVIVLIGLIGLAFIDPSLTPVQTFLRYWPYYIVLIVAGAFASVLINRSSK